MLFLDIGRNEIVSWEKRRSSRCLSAAFVAVFFKLLFYHLSIN